MNIHELHRQVISKGDILNGTLGEVAHVYLLLPGRQITMAR